MAAAQAIVAYLVMPKESFVGPPSSLTDVGHGNQSQAPARADIQVRTAVDRNGGEWYFIQPKHDLHVDCEYDLAVSDPLTVNHILRSNVAASVYEITRLLLRWGVPFKTFKRISNRDRARLLPVPSMPMFFNHIPLGLGIVSHNHDFTLADYHADVTQREGLLSSFQGRAALLFGGLLWRIARDSHKDDTDVCIGTSGFHTAFDCVEMREGTYVDDKLSAHQQDVICGVYRVAPETPEEGPGRAAHRSWWPSLNAWINAGVNHQYWSVGNEEWFVTRRDAILAGKAKPLSASQWRTALPKKKSKNTNIIDNARRLAFRTMPHAR